MRLSDLATLRTGLAAIALIGAAIMVLLAKVPVLPTRLIKTAARRV